MSSSPPPDAVQVTTEGRNLAEALRLAAAQLGVEPVQVDHKIDAAHFRNNFGAATGAETVKIFAWVRDPAQYAGAEAARAFVAQLIAHMGIEGHVVARVRGHQHAEILVDSEKARFLVGKQGWTLKSIRHLLAESVGRAHPSWTFHLEVTGGDREERHERGDREDRGERRERGERGDRGDRGDRRDRGDRGDRGDRRDRGDRGDRGGRDRGDRGDRGERRSDADVEALRQLALKIAQRVAETGQPEVLRRRLNSFERRVVHVAVAEVEGVGSQSIQQDDEKRIEIYRIVEGAGGEE